MKQLTALVLIFAVYSGLIAPVALQLNIQTNAQTIRRGTMKNEMSEQEKGLKIRLSEGVENAVTREKPPATATDPLSSDESGNLLKRLPPLKSDAAEQSDFVKRAESLPPPKTGKTVSVKFPAETPRAAQNAADERELKILRFSPEGAVKLAPDLSVTFSHPMVAVASQRQAAQTVPIEASPLPKGNWRWLGTKTLMFDAESRFPMATKFTVKVPGGTKSVTGQTLKNEVSWTFATPPPKAETMIPSNDQIVRRDAVMFISFDQAIDPAEVIKTISVTSNNKKITVRLAGEAEISENESIAYYVKQSQPNRWLAFRAVNPDGSTENALPPNAPVKVTILKGTPSAEGPLTTTEAQSFTYKTYGAMNFIKSYCSYNAAQKECKPYDSWRLEFSNPIDAENFDKMLVKIEPAIENLNIYPSGSSLIIDGEKPARTTFTVTVSNTLKDRFGQSLGQKAQAIFKTGAADSNLWTQGENFIVLDPNSKPGFSVYSTNFSRLKVKIHRVAPADWNLFQQYVKRINYDDKVEKPAIPGKLISDKILVLKNQPDEVIETRIDLTEFLDGGFGNLILDVQPVEDSSKAVQIYGNNRRIFSWVQATAIGLDAFVDNQELVGLATELRTGKPISGVELSIYPNGERIQSSKFEVQKTQNQSAFASWWNWALSFVTAIDAFDSENFASTEIIEPARTNQTGASGVLRLPLPEAQAKQQNILIAKRGKDIAFLPENSDYYWQESGNWFRKPQNDSLRWFTFTDRNMYRPNEEVAVKGYLRVYEGGKLGDIAQVGDQASGVNYKVFDARGNEIGNGTTNLNAFGAFDFKFKLPANVNLGYSRIELITNSKLQNSSTQQSFQIMEFRRPEFEVTAKSLTEAPFFIKDSANVVVEAKYYAGGGLANADVNWTVNSTPTNYTPPNRSDYTFGTWIPWWDSYDNDYDETTTEEFKGITDAGGKHVLKIDFESANPPRPFNVSASAAVQDVNRQTFAGSTNLLVHPSALYVGIKTPRTFVRKGENIVIESIVTDIDGNLIVNRDVSVKAELKDWRYDKGEWKEVTIDEQNCRIKSANEAQKCAFTAKQGGRYTITARVADDRERPNESELNIWVPGGQSEPKRTIEQEDAQIIPDKKDYAPGDVAEILVISPFAGAEGVLTLRRDGIVKTERFSMKESSTILRIPLEEKYLPNIHAQIDLVGAAARAGANGEINEKLAKRPAYASGEINLPISTGMRELTISAEPLDKTLSPGGETKIAVAVKDHTGKSIAGSEVAVIIVDESILALSKYDIADPLGIFYTERGEGVTDYHSRENVILDNPDFVGYGEGYGSGSGMGDGNASMMQTSVAYGVPPPPPPASDSAMREKKSNGNEQERQINLRQNFNALAVFAPNVVTDSNGRAAVDVKLPDNLTRYRVMAVAVDKGKMFGKAESSITARQPLMVRPSAPRFMNFGDKIELPVVVQNQTDKDLTVDVAVRAVNAELTDGGGKRVLIKANDRAEVRFPVSAVKAGTARFQFAATSNKYADAAEIELPIWTPATSEAFANYGTIGENGAIVQPVQAPSDVYPQFGGLEVTTSSTQLQELTDAFIYLQTYPFECTEQVASRMISVAALQNVLKAFETKEMPSPETLKTRFSKDVEILSSRQNANGYFGLWRKDNERYKFPFVTVHTAHALVLAKAKGYQIPEEMLTKVQPYLKDIESHFDENHKSSEVRRTISAYALYVRDLMGDRDSVKTKKLLSEAGVEKMPFEALGWILSVLADDKESQTEVETIRRFLVNRTTETAATANFVTDYGDNAWLIMYSNRRADGVLLEAFMKADPNNDLIPKLVRGLLDHRVKGAWANTQENVFILLALDKYFEAYEKVTPDFVTRVWLGNVYAGEQKFAGRSVDSNSLNVQMKYLLEQNGAANLILDKQGAGRLYYRIGLKYAPKNLNLAPADYGFTVLRKYEALDNADDVRQNSDGSWSVKAGARVRVRLTLVAPARRYHVALADNLPAGFEILNPDLAVTEAIPADRQSTATDVYSSRSFGGGIWWRRNWFEHQNFRDERAEAFSSLLWEGVYNYSYVTRATTPGRFIAPPAKAEEMYHPEVFGRSGTDFVRVE